MEVWRLDDKLAVKYKNVFKKHKREMFNIFSLRPCSWDLTPTLRSGNEEVDATVMDVRRLADPDCLGLTLLANYDHDYDLPMFIGGDNSISPTAASYESALSVFFLNYLRPGDNVVDIGANMGYYTLLASKAVGETGSVLSIEPSPENLTLLKKNITLHSLQNITVLDGACGDSPLTETILYVVDGNKGDNHTWQNPTDNIRREVRVPFFRLDDIVRDGRINLIKIDVQGYEPQVLRGAKQTINNQKKIALMIEFWSKGLQMAGNSVEDLAHLLFDTFGLTVFLSYPVCNSVFPQEAIPSLLHIPRKDLLISWGRQLHNNKTCDYVDLWCVK